jgi:hypothetical protein
VKRIYVVTGPKGDKARRLVNAHTSGGAINHCVKDHFTAKVPSQSELIELAKDGVEVEETGDAA